MRAVFCSKHRISLVTFFVLAFFLPTVAGAAIKDSDVDGLSDQAEREVYGTDPLQFDTDRDTIGDGQEILDETNPLDPTSSRLDNFAATEAFLAAKQESLPWLVGRASGILAFFLLSIVVVNGLLISTRLVFRVLPPPLNYEMHHYLAWTALLAVVGHVASFLFDPYLKLTLFEALIPFSAWRTFPSAFGFNLQWAIGLGTLALYGLLALGLSSYFKTSIPLRAWRFIHYASFGTYLLFLVHGIASGSDTQSWWMLLLYVLSGSIVGGLTLVRIVAAMRAKTTPLPNNPSE